ncbi:hypothetical protein LTS08_001243 [Lithohypha guttulata]|nr:hypothetical protein LTS08_001243 [Lithohypha guttulata]
MSNRRPFFETVVGRRGQRRPTRQGRRPDPYDKIHRIESFALPIDDQFSSPLFSDLPGEVRDLIYEYALADYEDLANAYELDTCYRRPDYMAPRKTDTALLRTCQAVYNDAWYLPWTLAQHTFFLTAPDRKPKNNTEPHQMERVSKLIERLHPDVLSRRKEVHNVQVFAQLYILEPGNSLNNVLQIPYFMPRTVTITIRHTDIWFWETDRPIYIRTPWINTVRFPTSVTTLRIQLESLQRRQPQIDYVVARAQQEWYFTRDDDVHLVSTAAPTATRWTGSSTWVNRRWVRDEDDQEPGVVHYYMSTLVFKPANMTEDENGYMARNAGKHARRTIEVPPDIAAKTNIPGTGYASLLTGRFEEMGITNKTPASEAVRCFREFLAVESRRNELNAAPVDE